MTVTTETSKISYTGDGITTAFPYPFRIDELVWLRVYFGAIQQGSGFTVSGVGNYNGGTVTFSTAPPAYTVITLLRAVPITQLVDYRPYDPFPAETHEAALDKLTFIAQQLSVGTTPVNDHSQLGNLSSDDHPQYHTDARGDARYINIAGDVMIGPLILPGAPTQPDQATTKQYVDQFVGSIITTQYISDATGDAAANVAGGWNTQANQLALTRSPNELIFYRWRSTDQNFYRYTGNDRGPTWGTLTTDWIVSAAGVPEAPIDSRTYGRKDGAWNQVVAAGTPINGPLLFADGTLSAPGIAWASEPNAGFYRTAPSNFAAAVGGTQTFGWDKTNFNIGGGVKANFFGPIAATQAVRLNNNIPLDWERADGAPSQVLKADGNNVLYLGGGAGWVKTVIYGGGVGNLQITDTGVFLYATLNCTHIATSGSLHLNNTSGILWQNNGGTYWEGLQGGGDNNFHVGRIGWTNTNIYGGGVVGLQVGGFVSVYKQFMAYANIQLWSSGFKTIDLGAGDGGIYFYRPGHESMSLLVQAANVDMRLIADINNWGRSTLELKHNLCQLLHSGNYLRFYAGGGILVQGSAQTGAGPGVAAAWTGESHQFQICVSARRFKKNITPLADGALDAIAKLKPITFNSAIEGDVPQRMLGFIAEDVEEAGIKELVRYRDGEPEGLEYERISVLLAKAVQELVTRVKTLEAR